MRLGWLDSIDEADRVLSEWVRGIAALERELDSLAHELAREAPECAGSAVSLDCVGCGAPWRAGRRCDYCGR